MSNINGTKVIRLFVTMPEPVHFAWLKSVLFNMERECTGSDSQ